MDIRFSDLQGFRLVKTKILGQYQVLTKLHLLELNLSNFLFQSCLDLLGLIYVQQHVIHEIRNINKNPTSVIFVIIKTNKLVLRFWELYCTQLF